MDPVELLVRQQYPQMAWALSDPELGPMLRQAASEGWDAARLQGALLNTGWYKRTTDAERTWDRLQAEDPATAHQQFTDALTNVQKLAQRVGVTVDGTQINQIALDAARSGWSDDRIISGIMNTATFTGNSTTGGDLGAAMDQVKSRANEFLIPVSDTDAWQMGKDLLTGKLDAQGLDANFRDLAKSRWTTYADRIDAGYTPGQIFAPYVQQAAQLLEISPTQINLMDPKWNSMVETNDPTSGQLRPMSLSEAARYVRATPDYRSTSGAMTEAANTAEFLLNKFGKVA